MSERKCAIFNFVLEDKNHVISDLYDDLVLFIFKVMNIEPTKSIHETDDEDDVVKNSEEVNDASPRATAVHIPGEPRLDIDPFINPEVPEP